MKRRVFLAAAMPAALAACGAKHVWDSDEELRAARFVSDEPPSITLFTVIGIPRALADLDGLDSLLSIVQMPGGVPVATVSIGGAKNAGLLAVRILGAGDEALVAQMADYQARMAAEVERKDEALRARLLGE